MFSPKSSTFSSSPLQRRAVGPSLASAATTAVHLVMPKPFSSAASSSSGLPLPSSSSRRRQTRSWGPLNSLSPRTRKRLMVGLMCLFSVMFLSVVTGNGVMFGLSAKNRSRDDFGFANNYAADAQPTRHGAPGSGYEREMHSLDEASMLAESELAVDNEIEEEAKTDEQIRAENERQKEKVLSQAQEKKHQLRALIRWIERGGSLPLSDYTAPSEQELKKMTGKQFERYLSGLEDALQPVPNPFDEEGWEGPADTRLAVTIFSKSYCPYSRNAKNIIEGYALHPSPFIIELDHRDDTGNMQDLLKSLTGRRTVPNVIAHFESIGGSDEVTLLHHEGTLRRKLVSYNLIP